MNSELMQRFQAAAETIRQRVGEAEIGVILGSGLGDYVDAHRPLAVIHAADEASWQQAAADFRRSITVSEQKPVKKPVIIEHIA